MQMVVSDASYPQMLSLIGSGVHYQSCCSKKQPIASYPLWLAGCLIAAEAAPPLSWQTADAKENPLSEM